MIPNTVSSDRLLTPMVVVYNRLHSGELNNDGVLRIDQSVIEEHNGFLRPILEHYNIPMSIYREILVLNNITNSFNIKVPSNETELVLNIPG